MKTLHQAFIEFNNEITLTESKKEKLRTSRDALQETITKWFKEHQPGHMPTFKAQGSFVMGTTLNQLPDDEYDIDLGVYISGYENETPANYPSPNTFHTWLDQATKNETNANNKVKYTCVRVTYSSGYHVDLPSYIVSNSGTIYLAHTRDNWVKSDPVQFSNWFKDAVSREGEQLRRVVKYIKAWKDYRKIKIPSVAISILVVNNFVKSDSHDEEALYETVKRINALLKIGFSCYKPVEPYENVFEEYTDARKDAITNGFDDFEKKMKIVLTTDKCEERKSNLNRLFGDRFCFDCDITFKKTDKPGVLATDGRSA